MATRPGSDRPPRPNTRNDFHIAILCALTLEADAVDAVLNRLMRFNVAKLQLAAVTRAIMQTVGLSVRMGAVTHRAGAGRALAVVCVVGPADRVGASGAGAAEVARGLPPARRAGWWVRQIGTAAFIHRVPVCAPCCASCLADLWRAPLATGARRGRA